MLLSEAWELYHADKTIERYSTATLKGYNIQVSLLIFLIAKKKAPGYPLAFSTSNHAQLKQHRYILSPFLREVFVLHKKVIRRYG